MITFKDILYHMEKRFDSFIDEKAIKILNSQCFKDIKVPSYNIAESNLFYLKNYLYGLKEQKELFELLKDNGYNAYSEIKHFIRELFIHRDAFMSEEEEIEYVVSRYINSPFIKSIEHFGEHFEVDSSQLGKYEFVFAEDYFKNDENVIFYLRNAPLEGHCHENVEFLTDKYPDFYSVTSLCETMFQGGKYYHSYCYDSVTNNVIDLCSKLVMPKEMYDRLFKTEEIFLVQGKNLSDAAQLALKYNRGLKHYFKPMICTLFQQYIWENNFLTPNSEVYSEEPKDTKILMKNRTDKVVMKK